MTTVRVLLLLLLCCLVSDVRAYAQRPPQKQEPPAARVTTRLVQVNVVAQDRNGQPVADLTRDDFEVTEQGKPQRISVFSIESNRKAIGRADVLPANTFSNLPSSAGATQNFTVILFDTLNTPFADQITAKRELIGFLQEIGPQDRVALYGLGNSLRALHDFTGNSAALVRAIAHYGTALSSDLVRSTPLTEDNSSAAITAQERAIVEEMDRFLNESNRLVADVYLERRMSLTLQALETISYHLAALPGRKSLIWISASFPFSYGSDIFQVNQANAGSKNFAENIASVARAITNANVAIYPVDARGFISSAVSNPGTSAAAVVGSARQPQRTDQAAMDQVLSSHNTMQELAERTGGRALYSTSDVKGAIQRALDDSRVTYTLGYYPSDTKLDRRFRTIKVSIKRPGVQLKYRRGYYAIPDEPSDDAHIQNAIVAAAARALDATGVSFSCRIDRSPATTGASPAGNSDLPLVLGIVPDSLKLDDNQGSWVGGIDLVFVQLDETGGIVASVGRSIPLRLTAAEHKQLLTDGLLLNTAVNLNPKSERVRIVIRDRMSGSLGTLTIPLR